jgi:hypothetical protein
MLPGPLSSRPDPDYPGRFLSGFGQDSATPWAAGRRLAENLIVSAGKAPHSYLGNFNMSVSGGRQGSER